MMWISVAFATSRSMRRKKTRNSSWRWREKHLPIIACGDVEGGKQGGRAMALVIVGHSSWPALLHREARLGAVQGLDLRFLVEGEHDGIVGWIQICLLYTSPSPRD